MGKSEKQMDKEQGRNQRIIDTAFRLFVEKKIEAVSMDEVAKEAGVGRATLFRCYNNKTELAIAVCASKWKAYLDKLDEARPISSIHDIPAIGRFIFTLDSYIGMYQNHKDLLQYNDNFNNYITHQTVRQEELANFHASLNSVNTRLHMMYAKAKEDKTFRTDIPEEQFMRVTVHTMMAACTHYAGGFIWGATDNKDYTGDLLILKEMILNYARKDEHLPEGKENPLPSRVAMMTDDVQQFAEMPKPVVIVDEEGNVLPADDPHRFFEASWMHKYKGKYYFSYSTGDTHYLCYAVGDNPYGPFTYKGVILEPVVGWTTHHSICEYKGQWYLFHHDCVPSNDTTWLRSVKVAPLFYDEDDNILPVQPE